MGPDGVFTVDVVRDDDDFKVTMGGKTYFIRLKRTEGTNISVSGISSKPLSVTLEEANDRRVELVVEGERLSFQRPTHGATAPLRGTPAATVAKDLLAAPLPGRVIGLMVKKGETVKAGDPLIIIESMKMETAVRSDRDGIVEDILVSEGTSVRRGQALARFRS